jgi:hypothetical protein
MENKSKINEHLTTLESFKYYLDHIITSIRDDNYNIKYVEDLAKTISEYYDKINSDSETNHGSDNEEPILELYPDLNHSEYIDTNFIDNSSDEELYGFYNNSETSNNDSKDEDDDDDNESKVESKFEIINKESKECTSNENTIQKININKKSKERLDKFIDGIFSVDKIHLYKKSNDYVDKLNKFNINSEIY